MLRNTSQWPQVPVRIGVGLCLMYDGYLWSFTRGGHANFVHILTTVGVPAPEVNAWVVGFLDFFGGLALVFGGFVGLVSILLLLETLARVTVIWFSGKGYPQPLPGQRPLPSYEMNLMYVACFIALIIAGAGKFSIDRYLQRRRIDGS